jgi:urease accessory protein
MICLDGRLQRAAGRAHLAVRRGAAGTEIETLHQSGCLKLRFPHTQHQAGHDAGVEAVLINISGGVADGDALGIALEAGAGAALTLSTPAAERIYRAMPGAPAARIDMQARIGAGARLDYLPQETLFFDGSALDRSLRIDLHPQGVFLGVEARLFGRLLSGEEVTDIRLRDRLILRRSGRLVLHDAIRMQGDPQPVLAAPAGAGGGKAVATLLYAAPDAAARLDVVRAALEGADAGASAWDGILMARLVAPDGQALRRAVVPALQCLMEKPLPRLWAS